MTRLKRTRKPTRRFAESAALNTPAKTALSVSSLQIIKKEKVWNEYWITAEHELFLQGLERHGKGNWKEIATIVQTKTWIQVQSHAQTHFSNIRFQQNQEALDENSNATTTIAAASKKRPLSAATTSDENNDSAALVTPATIIVTKKRRVIPFAIPSRGDTCVGESEALIRVVVAAQPEATQHKVATLIPSCTAKGTQAIGSTTEPLPKTRPAPTRQQ